MTCFSLMRPAGLVAGPFSHVALVAPGATTVHVGGQNGVDAAGALVGGADVVAQTRQVFANLTLALDSAGAGLGDVLSLSVLLVEDADLHAVAATATSAMPELGDPPLITVARVAGLAVPGAMLEVSAIAAIQR